MTEIEYRLKCLMQHKERFDGKRIALYGVADNASAIIHKFPEQNIIALLDQQHTGEYIFGKKVVSLEEVVQLRIEIIIIAAESRSSLIVSERIFDFCQTHHIQLLNMYGIEEVEIKHQSLLQEIAYMNFDEDKLLRKIMQNDVICFQLMDVLCAGKYFDEKDFIEALGNYYGYRQFVKRRMQAEERIDRRCAYGIDKIYKNYQVIASISREDIQNIQSREEDFFLDSIIPKRKMVEILNRVYDLGKKVYIISDLRYTRETVKRVLEKIGVQGYHGIIQENLQNITFSDGALRRGLAELFEQHVLYIGTRCNSNFMLAQMYHMDVCMLKDAWELLWQVSDFHIKRTDIPVENRSAFSEWVQNMLNSPFVKDNEEGQSASLGGKIGESLRLQRKSVKQMDLFPFPQYSCIEELGILEFPICEKPLVSVVIPVYNQFGYTYNCLKSILHNTGNIQYEVIIGDDGSTDDTVQLERVAKGIKILHNKKNVLFLRNCNQAASHAKGKYIIFLNNDTQVQCNWMESLVQLLENRSDIGMAGSKLLFPDGTLQEAGGIIWQDGTGANYGRGDSPDAPEYNYVKEVDYISGASIIVRKELWDEIDGFDERYVPAYCEDSDFAFEVRSHGRKVVYQPASEVVHFEGISNGTDLEEGVKRYQAVNEEKLRQKWQDILTNEQCRKTDGSFGARERKRNRKTIVMFSDLTPQYDCDAGSKTIYSYLKLFLEKGYLVKFVPEDFKKVDPYTYELQQMGIEVLHGDYYKKYIDMWLFEHQSEIEYAFVNFPNSGERFIDILKCTSIKIRYYGVDLHYLRKQREYALTGEQECMHLSEKFYKMERNILEKADQVYYPSEVEIQVIKREFNREAKLFLPFMYEWNREMTKYKPEEREGILFVGGFNHPPNVDAVLWFSTEIYPQINKIREMQFYIVGSNEPIEIQNLNQKGIIHMGYLSEEELQNLYRRIKLVIVPLRFGAGIKGKVVDAMYQGVPIVSTSIGTEGIPEAEKYIEIADDAKTFGEKVIDLYADDARLIETSENYKRVIKKYYSKEAAWEKIKDDF